MTAENNGPDGPPPEGDDPFAYLYRQEGEGGASAPERQAPRRSFDQVRPVGQRSYGGRPGQTPYQEGHGDAYGPQSPSAHYAAPETVPGGRDAVRQGPPQQSPAQHGRGGGHGAGHGGGQGRSRNGLLIGSIAVVAAVVLGICAAVFLPGDDDADSGGQAGGDPGNSAGSGQKNPGPKPVHKGQQVGQRAAAKLQLAGGAAPTKDIPGGKGQGGTYVGSLDQPGASATWNVTDVPKAGMYTFHIDYTATGDGAGARLTVNGKPQTRPMDLRKDWTDSYSFFPLKKGRNTIQVSCKDPAKCDVFLKRVRLEYGQKSS